ncbi:protein of unknown function DUF45 [Pirellula staleyi DSM 6068]|uniref:YgjP-like metallopeptidase domain-containing protein n=1 Tax=Pirellula staleyi (strain ATCC 27377 / DSM 6068 / ICPB 4128) TaxID=530564 RepID=D2R8Z1_PIRSD|nr:SprT family zinc-dependent metalloprotease [Pirellula staleyi]ADB15818.1 protein of unknown function DUF45 [Pirellula staleyi DSM 6068]
MSEVLQLGDLAIELIQKDIKNVHLSVHPPHGRVRIAVPKNMTRERVRVFAISKLAWIRQQQKKLREQARESRREYSERESHYVWGKRYLLTILEKNEPPKIELLHRKLRMTVRPVTDEVQRAALLEGWYRELIRQRAPDFIERWQKQLGVEHSKFFVRRMKTRWGSCNPVRRTIRLNTDLAKKPIECLEYVIVHELMHLLEPTHNARFVRLMNHHFPSWQQCRNLLNRLPVRHEDWRV